MSYLRGGDLAHGVPSSPKPWTVSMTTTFRREQIADRCLKLEDCVSIHRHLKIYSWAQQDAVIAE